MLPSHGIICPRGVPALLFSLLSAAAEEGSYNLDPLHPHYWTFLPFFFTEDIVATTASVLRTGPPRTSARGVTASFWRHSEPQQKRSAAAAGTATSSLEVGPAGLRRNAQTPGVSG